ncbi:MAG: DUF559 domain-containing protein [Clostridia bacterium]|nr:DUF559 domain-containing protein [Clostridia bacterium]
MSAIFKEVICQKARFQTKTPYMSAPLWYNFLKNYPVRFLRQKVIDSFIVDFYCHAARLVVEIDGSEHYVQPNLQKDISRTETIEKRHLKVIRIPNNEVHKNFRGVCEYIDICVKEALEFNEKKI